jgi:cyanophycin synthetase
VRLIEVRLLDGPNVYRLAPAVRIEVAVGRRRTWYGERLPARHAVVRLGVIVRPKDAPSVVVELASWVRRLHRRVLGTTTAVTIHRTSEPGRWVVAYPWSQRDTAEAIAQAALRLTDESVSPRLLERAVKSIAEADGGGPNWITDDQRKVPVISISGTNGKSTTTRMISHIALLAGRHVGTTTTDGVLVDERMLEPGDFTGPQGARAVLARQEVELAVLETARGGILLRGLGYQSNDASVLTNVSGDHLDLQGLHTLPELAEVKSVVCRVTRPNGAVVLNADDPLVVAVGRYVKAPVWLFSLRPRSALVRAHLAAGRRAYVFDDGWLVECNGRRTTRIVAVAEVRATLGGLARYVVANALAAAGGARALGFTIDEIAAGLRDFDNSPALMPGRLNLYAQGNRLVIVDYAHNVAGLEVLIDTAEALIGRRGHRQATLSVAIGSAGDRPDDYIRGIGRIAGSRADEVAIKEGLPYLRGRSRASVIGELREGLHAVGVSASAVPIYEDELDAIRGELTTPARPVRDDTPSAR